MRSSGIWLLVGVLVLLAGWSNDAGADDHAAQPHDQVASAPATASPIQRYVALGDSYTAGSGVPPIVDQNCLRSARNYPHRLAEALRSQLRDASCGGAQTADALSPQAGLATPVPPQLAGAGPRTDLVTITLGINDATFATVISRCYEVAVTDPQGAPCAASFRTAGGEDSVAALLPAVRNRVVHLIRAARSRAPHARVLVIGYPQLVPANGSCAALPFALGDYPYVRAFFRNVDTVMRQAARETRATYLDVLKASKGHTACSTHERLDGRGPGRQQGAAVPPASSVAPRGDAHGARDPDGDARPVACFRVKAGPTATVLAAVLLLGVAVTGCREDGPSGGGDRYVALGDSFTSGAGLPGTVPDGVGCGRSSLSYPRLAAKAVGAEPDRRQLRRRDDRERHPATVRRHRQPWPPQLDAVTKNTDLVTVSLGGNDFGWYLGADVRVHDDRQHPTPRGTRASGRAQHPSRT